MYWHLVPSILPPGISYGVFGGPGSTWKVTHNLVVNSRIHKLTEGLVLFLSCTIWGYWVLYCTTCYALKETVGAEKCPTWHKLYLKPYIIQFIHVLGSTNRIAFWKHKLKSFAGAIQFSVSHQGCKMALPTETLHPSKFYTYGCWHQGTMSPAVPLPKHHLSTHCL